jgi:hypothetical protein
MVALIPQARLGEIAVIMALISRRAWSLVQGRHLAARPAGRK